MTIENIIAGFLFTSMAGVVIWGSYWLAKHHHRLAVSLCVGLLAGCAVKVLLSLGLSSYQDWELAIGMVICVVIFWIVCPVVLAVRVWNGIVGRLNKVGRDVPIAPQSGGQGTARPTGKRK